MRFVMFKCVYNSAFFLSCELYQSPTFLILGQFIAIPYINQQLSKAIVSVNFAWAKHVQYDVVYNVSIRNEQTKKFRFIIGGDILMILL